MPGGDAFYNEGDVAKVVNFIRLNDGDVTKSILSIYQNVGGETKALFRRDLYAVNNGDDKLYRIHRTTGAATLVGSLGSGNWGSLGWDGSNIYTISNRRLYTVDRNTGAVTQVGSGNTLGNTSFSGLAFDGVDLYALETAADALLLINRTTGEQSRPEFPQGFFFNLEPSGAWIGLAWDGADLYAVNNSNDRLYTVTRIQGRATLVGSMGSGSWNNLAFGDGILYSIKNLSDGYALYTVDRSTGAATLVGSAHVSSLRFHGLTFPY